MFYSPHPLLRKRETETATVSYSELLFDLIYVFSVTQLSHYLLRILLFISMLVGLVMAAAIPYAFTYRGLIFAVCYVLIQAGRTLYIIGVLGDHHLAANFKRIMGWFCISAVFWITGAILQGFYRGL